MAQIRPFAGVRYSRTMGLDLSDLIAPPYDVLDEAGKRSLQAKRIRRILSRLICRICRPRRWDRMRRMRRRTIRCKTGCRRGFLRSDHKPAIYPYSQTYTHGERTFHRRGMIALVKLSPFGEGHVVPHEKTYADAIEDRLKLTRATRMQLSPIFGLFSDPKSQVTADVV